MNTPKKRQIVTHILSAWLLLAALFPFRIGASTLTLAWDPNIEYDLAGYKIYYGTQSGDYDSAIDVGYVTQYTVTGLVHETQYYLALTAYDTSYNESEFSEEVSGLSNPEQPTSNPLYKVIDSEEGYSEWGCFIATAAYGSYLHPHVKILRDFRDEFLISNFLGRKFVHLYYKCGPHIANRIGKHGFLRFLTRQALLPIIGIKLLSPKITVLKNYFFYNAASSSFSPLHSFYLSQTS